MCNVLNVSRSGDYKWKGRPQSNRGSQHKEWTDQVKEVFDASRQLYGIPKVAEKLHQQDVDISTRTVTRIMSEQQWKSRTVKKYKATTNSKHHLPVQENVLNREFTASQPNEKWVTDITYVATEEGWLKVYSKTGSYESQRQLLRQGLHRILSQCHQKRTVLSEQVRDTRAS